MITDKLAGVASGFKKKFSRETIEATVGNPYNATRQMRQPPVKALNVKKPKVGKVGSVDTAFYTKISVGQNQKLRKGDSVADVAAKLLNLIKQTEDERKKHFELFKDFEQEHIQEDERRHKELLDALRKPKETTENVSKEVEDKVKQPTKKTKETEKTAEQVENKVDKIPEKKIPEKAQTAKPTTEVKPKTVKQAPSKAIEAPGATATVTAPSVSSGVSTAAKVGIGAAAVGLLLPDATYASAIDDASRTIGVDRALMYAIARQESGFNPNAKPGTSSAKGLYQFISSTWREMTQKYGKDYPVLKKGPEDAQASAIAGALFIKENSVILAKAKIPVDATSVYAAHFLGPGGAKTLFTADSNRKAAEIMPKAAAANDFIFYEKTGKSIDKSKPRTVKQVIDILFQKVGQYQQKYAEVLQQQDSGTQLAQTSTQNKELKTTQGNTVIIDNTTTTIATTSSKPSSQALRVASSPDLPLHQRG